MAIMDTNWQTFLSPDSDLPPDIFSLVISEDDENPDAAGKSIGAHRLFLAGVSPVFRGMLFGPIKENQDTIKVKERSYEAFSTMFSFIYKVPGEDFSLTDIRCPQKLFELLTVADKYAILSLKTLASDALGSMAISRENIIFAATVAKNYKPLFEDVSEKLLVRCCKFLLDTTARGRNLFALMSKNFPDGCLDILHALINLASESLHGPGV